MSVNKKSKSYITNCVIKLRKNDTSLFKEVGCNDDGAVYVNIDGYLIVPLETSIAEIKRIKKSNK